MTTTTTTTTTKASEAEAKAKAKAIAKASEAEAKATNEAAEAEAKAEADRTKATTTTKAKAEAEAAKATKAADAIVVATIDTPAKLAKALTTLAKASEASERAGTWSVIGYWQTAAEAIVMLYRTRLAAGLVPADAIVSDVAKRSRTAMANAGAISEEAANNGDYGYKWNYLQLVMASYQYGTMLATAEADLIATNKATGAKAIVERARTLATGGRKSDKAETNAAIAAAMPDVMAAIIAGDDPIDHGAKGEAEAIKRATSPKLAAVTEAIRDLANAGEAEALATVRAMVTAALAKVAADKAEAEAA